MHSKLFNRCYLHLIHTAHVYLVFIVLWKLLSVFVLLVYFNICIKYNINIYV